MQSENKAASKDLSIEAMAIKRIIVVHIHENDTENNNRKKYVVYHVDHRFHSF